MKTSKSPSIPPLPGARELWDENQQPYALPVLELPPALKKKTAALRDAKSWADHWSQNHRKMSLEHQISCLQQAVMIDPTYARAWHSLACTYELQGRDWYAATHCWNQVVFLTPNSDVAWFSLSQLWAGRGMMGKARECLAEYERLSGSGPETKAKAWWEFWK
jgi:tetratricopeptide (TPR) repeat protein